MSSKDDARMNYRDRGRRAASRRGAGKHSAGKHELGAAEQFKPIDVDALVAHQQEASTGTPGTLPGNEVAHPAGTPAVQVNVPQVGEIGAPEQAPAPNPIAALSDVSFENWDTDEEKPRIPKALEQRGEAAGAPEPPEAPESSEGSEPPEAPAEEGREKPVTSQEPLEEAPVAILEAPEEAPAVPEVQEAPAVAVIGEREPAEATPAQLGHSELPGTVEDFSRESAVYRHRKGSNFSRAQKTALIVVALVAVILCSLAGAAFALWQDAEKGIQLEDPGISDALTPVASSVDPYWTLILGSDSRSESTDRARSDVILLCRIDQNNKQFTLVSIPRDTKVYIEGYGTQKINAAYALGGAELAISTIEDFAGIQVSHYAEIYFSGLEDLVNTLGGVTVDVPEYCSYSDVTLYPGEQELTGHEALIFARCRKTYALGDFTRTQCQRILATALAEKVLSQSVTELPATIQSISQCFNTDMTLSELVALATSLQGISSSSIYSGMAPSTTGMVDGVSYTFTYINQWKLLMQRADNGEKPKLTAKEEDICGTLATDYNDLDMSAGLPADVASQLQVYWDKKASKKAKQEAAAAAKQDAATSTDVPSASADASSIGSGVPSVSATATGDGQAVE